MSAVLCHLDQPIPPDAPFYIFGMGPLPRTPNEHSHHAEAFHLIGLAVAQGLLPEGTVYIIPECREGATFDYDAQAIAERRAINFSVILCWVPRDITGNMLGLTTNIEAGRYYTRPDFFIGGPPDRPEVRKNKYLQQMIEGYGKPWHDNLDLLITSIVVYYKSLQRGHANSLRLAATQSLALEVPACIRALDSFEHWLSSIKEEGNELRSFELLSTYCVGKAKEIILSWRAQVSIYIPSEKRYKSNEFVDCRRPFSTTVVFSKNGFDTWLLLVGEVRSPAGGVYYSHPSGSCWTPDITALEVAAQELQEETGIVMSGDRFDYHGQVPCALLMNAAQTALFSVQISQKEMTSIAERIKNNTYGNKDETEITHPVVVCFSDALRLLDAMNVGLMIQAGVCQS